jgi:hypothetical protein
MRRIFAQIKDRMCESHLIIDPAPTSKDFQLVVFAAGGFTGSFSGVAVGVG